MTNREKKQKEILSILYMQGRSRRSFREGGESIDYALSELSKLDAIPTSKEIEDAVHIAKLMIKIYEERGGGYSQKEALRTLIQAINPKEEGEK